MEPWGAATREAPRHDGPAALPALLTPGRNCGAVAKAGRAAILIDAAIYFARLEQALRAARRSILIVGWDFDAGICLNGDTPERKLGPFLRRLVEEHPGLHIHILIWSLSLLHAPGDPRPLLFGAPWQRHPRIHLKLDREHPLYGCHHQKIVVVDDAAAFVGGIDLTVSRRDSQRHAVETARRCDPGGKPYGPVHDVQMLVDGDAAAAIAREARERWRLATGTVLAPAVSGRDPWPEGLTPDFRDIPVGIVRTAPAWHGRAGTGEGGVLFEDLIAAARRHLYLEAQYFTSESVGAALCRSLSQSEGPEIVLVANHQGEGLVEKFVMARNRDRMLRRLMRADRHHRLRAFHPQVPGRQGRAPVSVHSKLLIADDAWLRVGSANLNNRSMGLDTECDLLLGARDGREQAAIARIRSRLLGEHLGGDAGAVEQRTQQSGSLIETVAAFNGGPRCLAPFVLAPEGPVRPVPGTGLFDPHAPWRLFGAGLFPAQEKLRQQERR
jgi:phosphatidylserine/phosphatidylglycerophosphate/cardiolipin synthase-like enzyme